MQFLLVHYRKILYKTIITLKKTLWVILNKSLSFTIQKIIPHFKNISIQSYLFIFLRECTFQFRKRYEINFIMSLFTVLASFSSVQSLSHVRLFVTPWTAAHQASLSITQSWSLLKLMSIESVMPSNHLILVIPFSSCLQSFPASGSFLMSQFFPSGGQIIGVSTSASVLPMNI